jgi:hypothetical protein
MKTEQIQTPMLSDLPIDELGPNERLDHESAIIAERRMKAARLYAAKKPMRAIAAELRCLLGTVHTHQKVLVKLVAGVDPMELV